MTVKDVFLMFGLILWLALSDGKLGRQGAVSGSHWVGEFKSKMCCFSLFSGFREETGPSDSYLWCFYLASSTLNQAAKKE